MNEAVFCELLSEARPKIENYARKLVFNSVLRDRLEPADLVQDTLLRAWRHRAVFDPARAKFSTWLCEIMKNSFLNLLRNFRREKRIMRRESELPDPLLYTSQPAETDGADCEVETAALEVETAELVEECCGRLTQKLREVFVAIEIRGMTYKETVSFLKIPLGTVRSRLHRARAKLRSEPKLLALVSER